MLNCNVFFCILIMKIDFLLQKIVVKVTVFLIILFNSLLENILCISVFLFFCINPFRPKFLNLQQYAKNVRFNTL
jgi:hypothetical protein